MAAKKNVLGFIDPGREIGRSSLIRVQFLHQGAVRAADGVRARAGFQAKDLISLLFGHFGSARRVSPPRCRVTLRVFTPRGVPAVKIRHQ